MGNILTIIEHDPSGRTGILRVQAVCAQLGLNALGVATSLSSQQELVISKGCQLNLPLNKDFVADQITCLRDFDVNAIIIALVHQAETIDVIMQEVVFCFPKAPRILLLANGNGNKNNISSEMIKLNQKHFLPGAYVSILPACCSESITGISVFDVETALQASQFLSRNTNGMIIVLFEKDKKICCTMSINNSSVLVKDIDISFGLGKNYSLIKSTNLSCLSYDLGVFIASIWEDNEELDFALLRKHLDKISSKSTKLSS